MKEEGRGIQAEACMATARDCEGTQCGGRGDTGPVQANTESWKGRREQGQAEGCLGIIQIWVSLDMHAGSKRKMTNLTTRYYLGAQQTLLPLCPPRILSLLPAPALPVAAFSPPFMPHPFLTLPPSPLKCLWPGPPATHSPPRHPGRACPADPV